ncbi:MAG: grasp-with-spasm system SPASM domain peptide maturase [Bacteroidales bacterium]|nr:grasp-with-spasm system SPASM domain peptide maturase [Bacteroidales bacterium]
MIKIKENLFFMLYACCIPVKGAKRSIICDLQRDTFTYVTNEIFDMLNRPISLDKIKDSAEKNDVTAILNYLKEQGIGFYTSNPENFPKIDFASNDFPEIVKNAIIDFDKNSDHNLLSIVEQLSELRCSAVELRFFDEISQDNFTEYLSCFAKSTVRALKVVLKYSEWTTIENMDEILFDNKRLRKIVIHHSSNTLSQKPNTQSRIHYVTDQIKDAYHCGNISPYYFISNISFFKEALTSNTCLDKKVCVDSKGYIKNCPAMDTSYGHINTTKLKDCLNNEQFKKMWHIQKDDIEICKDCEFRYICTDCRAFITNDNLFSKPKKCNYDPYENTWN